MRDQRGKSVLADQMVQNLDAGFFKVFGQIHLLISEKMVPKNLTFEFSLRRRRSAGTKGQASTLPRTRKRRNIALKTAAMYAIENNTIA
jgi:hypothetical protein